MKRTQPLLQISAALMDHADARHYGYGIIKVTGIRSGVLYPILHRMLDEGWLMTVGRNSRRPEDAGRPNAATTS